MLHTDTQTAPSIGTHDDPLVRAWFAAAFAVRVTANAMHGYGDRRGMSADERATFRPILADLLGARHRARAAVEAAGYEILDADPTANITVVTPDGERFEVIRR